MPAEGMAKNLKSTECSHHTVSIGKIKRSIVFDDGAVFHVVIKCDRTEITLYRCRIRHVRRQRCIGNGNSNRKINSALQCRGTVGINIGRAKTIILFTGKKKTYLRKEKKSQQA